MSKAKYLDVIGATLLAGLTGCAAVGSQQKGVAAKNSSAASMASAAKSPVTPPPAKQQRQEVAIQELSAREETGQTIIDIKLSTPVSRYRHFPLTQPARIVLDIFDDNVSVPDAESFQLNTHAVGSVRLSHGEGYLRVTIDSASTSLPPYLVTSEGGGVRLSVGAADASAPARRDFVLLRSGKRVSIASAESKSTRDTKGEIAQKEEAGSEAEKYTGQKLSLDFKDADIKNIFRLLAEVSGKNIVVTDDVNRKVTIRLVEVPWDQAMDILIQTHGLGMEEVGNVVRISTTGRLKSDRDALTASKKSGELSEELQTAYLTVNYARVIRGKDDKDSSDKDLVDKVKTVLSPRGTVVADQRTNTLVVRDIKKGIEEAQSFLAKLDTRTPQVLIESNLIETTPSFSRSLGIEMEALFNDNRIRTTSRFKAGPPFDGSPQPVPAENLLIVPNTGFRLGYFGNNITGILSAAEAEGNVRILSRPSVVTLNNVESTIESSETIRVKKPAATVGEAGGIESFKAGIILTVTPQVSADGFVLLKISVKNSVFDFSRTIEQVPREVAREAKANVLVRDGETVVIGGIMKDTNSSSETGVPYLRHIPVLGWLFKKTASENNLDEMVVFITPRIIDAGAGDRPTAEQIWREQLKKTEGDKTAFHAAP